MLATAGQPSTATGMRSQTSGLRLIDAAETRAPFETILHSEIDIGYH
jgi:hypothetical protein